MFMQNQQSNSWIIVVLFFMCFFWFSLLQWKYLQNTRWLKCIYKVNLINQLSYMLSKCNGHWAILLETSSMPIAFNGYLKKLLQQTRKKLFDEKKKDEQNITIPPEHSYGSDEFILPQLFFILFSPLFKLYSRTSRFAFIVTLNLSLFF